MAENLTSTYVRDQVKIPDSGEIFVWDSKIAGLGLRVTASSRKHPDGMKTWVFQYRTKLGQSRREKLGRFPQIDSDTARSMATKKSVAIHDGRDPAREAREAKAKATDARQNTLEAVADEWLRKTYWERKLPGGAVVELKTAAEAQRTLDKYVKPALGKRAISEITDDDIERLLERVSENHGPRQADKVLARLRTMFKWARKKIDKDPTYGIKLEVETEHGRALDDDELRWVWKAASALPYPAGPYVQLLILCGQRRRETAGLKASSINPAERLWTMPPKTYKTKTHNEVPFGTLAWSIVEPLIRQAQEAGRDHVFVSVIKSRGDLAISNFSGIKEAVDTKLAEMGAPVLPWTLHDLRHTMKSKMGALDISDLVSELCLGHSRTGIQGTYDHEKYRKQKRSAYDIYANHVTGADNIVRFPASA
jgi:hypothetical protein